MTTAKIPQMAAEIVLRGTVVSLRQSTDAKGRPNGPPNIQLVKESSRGEIQLINIKLFDNADQKKFERGAEVEVVADYSMFEGRIFWTAVRDAKEKPERSTPSPAKSA